MWAIYKKQRKNPKETRDSRYIYQKEPGKPCFQHDMAYRDFKDLTRRTASNKILRDKAYNIPKNPKYDGYQRRFALMVYTFFDKETSGETSTLENKSEIKNKNISNKQLAEELHKTIIRNFNKRKAHSPFIDNISGADLADMHLISKFNIDIYSIYACVIHLKDKKGITITNAFQKSLKESNRKPHKIRVG